jgi:hypothetical protein
MPIPAKLDMFCSTGFAFLIIDQDLPRLFYRWEELNKPKSAM